MTGPRMAWAGLAAAPAAWAAQLGLGYSFEEAACGRPDANLWGVGVEALSVAAVVAAGAIAVASGAACLASWRRADAECDGVGRFVAAAGTLSAAIFAFAILLSGLALIPLHGCAAG